MFGVIFRPLTALMAEKQLRRPRNRPFSALFCKLLINQPASADSQPVQDSGAPLPCPFEEEVRTQSVTRLSEDKQGVPQILDLIFQEFHFAQSGSHCLLTSSSNGQGRGASESWTGCESAEAGWLIKGKASGSSRPPNISINPSLS